MACYLEVYYDETTVPLTLTSAESGPSFPKCDCNRTPRSPYVFECIEPDHYGLLGKLPRDHFSPYGVFLCINPQCGGHPRPERHCYGEYCVFYWYDAQSQLLESHREPALKLGAMADKKYYRIGDGWSVVSTKGYQEGNCKYLNRRMVQLQKEYERVEKAKMEERYPQ